MSYEEVRAGFLQYYEKRQKLQLLKAELLNIVQDAQKNRVDDSQLDTHFGGHTFQLNVVESVLIGPYACHSIAPPAHV
jgi:hypothetical protein